MYPINKERSHIKIAKNQVLNSQVSDPSSSLCGPSFFLSYLLLLSLLIYLETPSHRLGSALPLHAYQSLWVSLLAVWNETARFGNSQLALRVCWPAREARTGKSPKVLPESALRNRGALGSTPLRALSGSTFGDFPVHASQAGQQTVKLACNPSGFKPRP